MTAGPRCADYSGDRIFSALSSYAKPHEDQGKMDEALVAANRWLRRYGFDWDILDGVARLRGANLPSQVALKEGAPT